MRILSVLESVEIAEVEARREEIAREHFTSGEIAAISGRRVQTLAGLLAAKRALASLHAACAPGALRTPRDFVIGHTPAGAPILRSGPELAFRGAAAPVRISISHTRGWAYGLAVVEEPGDA